MTRLSPPRLLLAATVLLTSVTLVGTLGPVASAMPAPPSGERTTGETERPATSSSGAASPAERPRGEWPLQPRPEVASYFDPPEVRWGSGHRGVDLRGQTGQHVRTAMAGRVSFAGRIAGTPVVVVDHGGTRTTYQPVSATVARGDEVVAGQVIGRLVWSGTHCSPAACLHWGWIRGETYLDPLLLVGAAPRPVRLLPL